MKNSDAIILALGSVMFVLGYLTASIIHNQQKRKLNAEIEQIKEAANNFYLEGWEDGWESLAMDTEAMKREITKAQNLNSPHRP